VLVFGLSFLEEIRKVMYEQNENINKEIEIKVKKYIVEVKSNGMSTRKLCHSIKWTTMLFTRVAEEAKKGNTQYVKK
jgi:hypothetical protein